MQAFHDDMKKLAKHNDDFRRVLFTGPNSQLVLMCIQPGEEIGEERHHVDQLFYFVAGSGEAIVEGEVRRVEEHDAVVVPAGTPHNFRNTGRRPLRLFTSYAPPEHPDGTVHHTKRDAEAAEREEDEARAMRAESLLP
jgi:mannose-6-phosphate isomerase-like protein (cupin superfamily)